MDAAGGATVLCNHRSMTEEFLLRGFLRFGIATLVAFVFCICLPLTLPSARAAILQAATKSDAASIRKLELNYDKAVVGAEVRVAAQGLHAGETVDLKWGTVTGGWVIQDYYYFRGRKYSEKALSLGKFPVSASGRLD